MNKLIFVLTLTVWGAAHANILNNCPPYSKDPRCWENTCHPKDPRCPKFPPNPVCSSAHNCARITKIVSGTGGSYLCKSQGEQTFDCTKLFLKHGSAILQEAVLVITPRYDTCHVPGACGNHACHSSLGYAELSVSCK